jgi:hypothetical protein
MSQKNNVSSEILKFSGIVSIVTMLIIFWSFEHGRLQYQMDYEDIITHIDGLKRWRDLSEGGVGVYLASYLKLPPHAPLHSLMASLGFMLFGVKDWAPYAVNAVVLFAFLALVRHETRPFGSWSSWLAVCGALFVPVAFESIHEFRPDFPCALATLWGMFLYPRLGDQKFGKKAALSGLAFGLALLAKPPFFPYTLAMGGLPWLMTLVEGARGKKSIQGIWSPIFKSWPFFAGAILVAGPHYLVAWQKILGYIQQNQFGADAHVWRMKGGLAYQLGYHLYGVGGQFMLGKDIFILFGLAGSGLIMSFLLRKSDAENVISFLRLFGFMGWAWLLIAVNPHENPFFGLTFQYGLVLVAMFALAWISNMAFSAKWQFKISMVLPIAAFMGLVWLAFPLPQYAQNTGAASATNLNPAEAKEFATTLPTKVYEIMKKWRPYSDGGYTLLSSYGIVSSHRLQWLADKEKQDFTVYAVPFLPLAELPILFKQDPNQVHHVDFVMVTEADAEGVFQQLPNAKTSGGLLEWISKEPSYSLVETLKTPSGKKYCIFMGIPNFSIFSSTEGLAPKSKPLEIAGHPVVMPATSGKVSLDYESPASGIGKMELSMRGPKQHLMVQVSNNGKKQVEYAVDLSDQISEKEFPIQLGKGINDLVISLMDSQGNVLTSPSVHFSRIRITPPGDVSAIEDIFRKFGKSSH